MESTWRALRALEDSNRHLRIHGLGRDLSVYPGSKCPIMLSCSHALVLWWLMGRWGMEGWSGSEWKAGLDIAQCPLHSGDPLPTCPHLPTTHRHGTRVSLFLGVFKAGTPIKE